MRGSAVLALFQGLLGFVFLLHYPSGWWLWVLTIAHAAICIYNDLEAGQL